MKTIMVLFLCLGVAAPALAQQVTYRKDIRPLWEARCAGCHGAASPYLGEFDENPGKYKATGKGPRMDTYADLLFFIAWPDTGAIMRRLDDGKNSKEGKPGNMYVTLGANEEQRQRNLNLFKAWIGPSAWNLKRRDAISKEELDRIEARY